MTSTPDFTGLTNLISERIGTKVLSVSDDFFAEAPAMLKEGRGVFIADRYTDRGKWMDGWESRRKRVPGYDWCILKMGLRGVIHGFDIDTNHFLGNHPPFASVDGASTTQRTPSEKDWQEIVAKSPLKPGSQNFFAVTTRKEWTHLRLNIYPDGGVARFKAYGHVAPDWTQLDPKELVDLANIRWGGRVLTCNDMFFGPKDNLILPGRGTGMHDGWETKRKREPGHDWAILRLGHSGRIRRIEVDTAHFKGNFPDRCSVDACYAPDLKDDQISQYKAWTTILPEQKLYADEEHVYLKELKANDEQYSHVRLNIYPDGGVSRLRIFGYRE